MSLGNRRRAVDPPISDVDDYTGTKASRVS